MVSVVFENDWSDLILFMVKCAFHVFNRRFNFGRAKIIIIIIVIIIISQENVQSKQYMITNAFLNMTGWS